MPKPKKINYEKYAEKAPAKKENQNSPQFKEFFKRGNHCYVKGNYQEAINYYLEKL